MNERELSEVVDALVATYEQPIEQRLPARDAIIDVTDQIRRLLFPGYYAEESLPTASCRYRIGTWVCQLLTSLQRIVFKALVHEEAEECREAIGEKAKQLTEAFVRVLPDLRERLLQDAEAALQGDPAAHDLDEIILTYPGFLAITVYRVAHYLYSEGVPYIPRAMSEYAHSITGVDIHPGARIGRYFFIDHGTGVVIGETTDIGEWVKIYQGVTLGALSVKRTFAGTKRHPTLEDRVVIYAGATVLGGETVIGRGAVIGSNVWLTSSVDPHMTVIETPPALSIKAQRRAGRS